MQIQAPDSRRDVGERITDARAMASPPSIHTEGFELWDAPSTVADFTDEDAIRNRYYPEAAELAKYSTGLETIRSVRGLP
jgi:hypothetical protein